MTPDKKIFRQKSLEALFENSLDAIVSVDGKYRIVDINQAFVDLFGYNLREIQGKHIDDVMNLGKEGSANKALTTAILSGKPVEEEGIRYKRDGKPIDVLIKGFKIIIDGKMAGGYGIYADITERKRAEIILKESESRNRAILNAIPDLIFIYSRNGIYLDYHASDKSLLAAKTEFFLGKSVHDILPADVAKQTMHCFDQIYKTGQTQLMEYSLNLPGGLRFFEARVTIMDEKRLLAVVRDITEQKQAEEALKKSNENLRETERIARMGRWELDLVKNRLEWSPTIFDIFEIDPDKFSATYEAFIESIHPEDREIVNQSYQQSIAEKKPCKLEHRLLMKDGRIKWVSEICHSIYDSEGQAIRSVGVVQDITERKNVEEESRVQRQRLENIIEGAGVGTWEWDVQSGVTVYNENWAKMVGYTLDELQPVNNKTWEMLAHPDDLKKSDEIAERHLEGELPFYECECRMKHKDGHWIWVLDRGKILTRSSDGKPLSMFGTHTDITDRKHAEEHIRYVGLHDSLTKLYNRNFIEEEMKRLDDAKQLPISIIMVDLNGLKLINDTYGHRVGDEALICAANIIRKACRSEDIVARWGGDEFVILMPQTNIEQALILHKRIIEGCRNVFVEDVPVSMALGISCKTEAESDMEEILRQAEDNMYKQKLTDSRSTKSAVLRALLKTLEAKSYETEAHTRGMLEIAKKIGEKLNLPDAEISRLDLLITLHDIGKINITEEILTKKSSLTAEEWETIKKHPEIGFRIARATEEFAHVAYDILYHHERWDGSGYPQGLENEEIPLLARITAIADAYEIMINGRPYKKALSPEEVAAELKKCAGTHFDPELVEIFLSLDSV